jgi:1,2-diacylglycerol 3-beta-galactosyltransferase
VTVVTDLGGAHPTWFHKEVDLCFVPSDPVRKIALDMGLKNDQIRQHGLPIRPGFWKPDARDKGYWRKELGIKDARTALVVGGGDGIGNLVEITSAMADALGKEKEQRQVVVICGKNEAIRKELSSKRCAGPPAWGRGVGVALGRYCVPRIVCEPQSCRFLRLLTQTGCFVASSWPSNVNVVVKGFVNNMDAWMASSDCIVTKAGPGEAPALVRP